MKLDALDHRIISLRRSQHISRDAIADRMGVPRSTVRNRIKRMMMGGIQLFTPRGEDKWTPELLAKLTELWIAGLLTAEQIGDELDVSKGSVIGKVHRLGLTARRKHVIRPSKAAKPRKSRAKSQSSAHTSTVPQRSKPVPVPKTEAKMCCTQFITETVRFIDHDERKQCCWVIGEPRGHDTLYCAARKIAGSSWCGYHYRLGYTATQPNKNVVPLRREWAA